jgi:hypothetical protein
VEFARNDLPKHVEIQIHINPTASGLTAQDLEFLESLAGDLPGWTQQTVVPLAKLPLGDGDFVVNRDSSTFNWQPEGNFVLEAHIILPDDPATWAIRDQVEREVTGWCRARVITYKSVSRNYAEAGNPLLIATPVDIRGHEEMTDGYAEQQDVFVRHDGPADDYDPCGNNI